MKTFLANSASKILHAHDKYSTIVGTTQPIFDGIASSIQSISEFIWNSLPVAIAIGSMQESRFIQTGIRKASNIFAAIQNRSGISIKKHFLNQDQWVKQLQKKSDELELKIQHAYYKIFNKPLLLNQMQFSSEEYQTIATHFQKFIATHRSTPLIESPNSLIDIERLVDFLYDEEVTGSEQLRKEIAQEVEKINVEPELQSSENPMVVESEQAFQNCYHLFLIKEILGKFQKGNVKEEDLRVFLRNYNPNWAINFATGMTVENIGEAFGGIVGELITNSSLAGVTQNVINKNRIGSIVLSISPLRSLLGMFSSYLGITLASYIGTKALGGQDSLKDYVHNMTWSTIATMIAEYAVELSETTNPLYTYLIPLTAAHIAYNFSGLYKQLITNRYITEIVAERHPLMIESLNDALCDQYIKSLEPISNINPREIQAFAQNILGQEVASISTNYFSELSRASINQFPYAEHIIEVMQLIDAETPIKDQIETVFNNLNIRSEIFDRIDPKSIKDLLIKNCDKENTSKQMKIISNYIFENERFISPILGKFVTFYKNLISNEDLLERIYKERASIVDASSKISSYPEVELLPDMQSMIFACVMSSLKSSQEVNGTIFDLIATKVNEFLPTSLFQSIAKKFDKSLNIKLHPLARIEPLFLEVIVKSFLIKTLLELKLFGIEETPFSRDLLLSNTCKTIETLLHINLVSQHASQNQSYFNKLIYYWIHKELSNAATELPEMFRASA